MSLDFKIKIWDVQSGKILKILIEHIHSVGSVAISPDSLFIVSGSEDKTIRIWSTLEEGYEKKRKALKGHTGYVLIVKTSIDGKYIFSGSKDNTIKIWNFK